MTKIGYGMAELAVDETTNSREAAENIDKELEMIKNFRNSCERINKQ